MMQPGSKKFILIIIFLIVASVIIFWWRDFFDINQIDNFTNKSTTAFVSTEKRILKVGSDILIVDVATSISDQARGLAGQDNLTDNYGMLFVFSYAKIQHFWMKDMLVDIDMIWLKSDSTTGRSVIVGYEDNIPVESGISLNQLKIYTSPEPVDQVLEVRAGLRAARNWTIGTIVEFN